VRRVSYQAAPGDGVPAPPVAVYVRLGDDAIGTRRTDARRAITVEVSKAQRRWLRDAAALTGSRLDEDAIVRALLDLGAELDIDWAVIASGKALRAAVRESVMVRRRPEG
jgi:hypothetical protein